MKILGYDAVKAVDYAQKFALFPNPQYYFYDSLGGDCTNFCSQCLYAACPQMNYMKTFGWYYKSADNKAPAWTGIEPFSKFITTNKSYGPHGYEISLDNIKAGSFIQLSFDKDTFTHNAIVSALSFPLNLDNICICCHSYNRLNAPLSSLPPFQKIRIIEIAGYRK